MARFTAGAAVLRLEDRLDRRAVVAEVADAPDGTLYRLAYAEGGEGWWPEEAIEPDDAAS